MVFLGYVRGPQEGPKGCHPDARRPSRSFAEVALDTPTMQVVQDLWEGLGTPHALGCGFM
jgi:hypothetical protein